VSAGKAVVVGSGAGGSVAAYVLAAAGWEVVVLEKGVDRYGDLVGLGPPLFANDELKETVRYFSDADTFAEPRTFRPSASDGDRTFVGLVDQLATGVGGGTMHWDAKTPRFWEIDFHLATTFGVPAGTTLADWPLSYAELEPYYSAVESVIGVQGDAASHPDFMREPSSRVPGGAAQAPRSGPYPMAPGPQQLDSTLLAEAARSLGYQPFPFAMAANSVPRDGRPACVNCGMCSSFGCPNQSRGGAAVTFLHRALEAGARLVTEAFAYRVATAGSRATGVHYLDVSGWPQRRERFEAADLVVLALSAVETARFALMSGIGGDLVGRNLMLHWFTYGFGTAPTRMHAYRGRASTQTLEDFVIPDTTAGRAVGLPYLRGGNLELGGSTWPIAEATYLNPALKGKEAKDWMRLSPIRDRILAITMGAEDWPTADKRVDLDPVVKDIYGFPVARVTYSPTNFELQSQAYIGPKLAAIIKKAGALYSGWISVTAPPTGVPGSPAPPGLSNVPSGDHVMGTMRMGDDPRTSVTDPAGRIHGTDNVVVTDGSVFPTSSGHNPTLTIMAVAMHSLHRLLGLPLPGATKSAGAPRLPATGASAGWQEGAGAAAAAGAAALALARRADAPAPEN